MPSGVTSRHARTATRRQPRVRAGLVGALAVIAAALGGGIYLATATSAGHVPDEVPGSAPGRETTAARTPSAAAPAPHPSGRLNDYRVGESWLTFTEHLSTVPGNRALHVAVRFPEISPAGAGAGAAARRFPLIIFAPGYRQCSASYSVLLRQWASAGYVVAAVNFPRTNCHDASPDEADLVNQPADLAFVIRQLDRLTSRPQGRLAGLIDASRVAVAGHSDGGDTVAAMAGMSCCRYPGLRAAIVLAGAEWPAFAGRWFAAPTAPILFVQGSADTWNPQAASLQLYQADASGTRYYLELFGADHFTPYEGDGAPEPIVARVTLDFLDRYLAGGNGTISALLRAGHVPGVSQLDGGGRLP
jgi:predicted dienelactone hydrolase